MIGAGREADRRKEEHRGVRIVANTTSVAIAPSATLGLGYAASGYPAVAMAVANACDTPIVAAPDPTEIAADRLSANKAQILHDLNLAILLFIEDNPDLPAHYGRRAWRRVAGRSWKWARREVGRPLWSHELALCLGGQFPWGAHEKCREFLKTFTESDRVRQPKIIAQCIL